MRLLAEAATLRFNGMQQSITTLTLNPTLDISTSVGSICPEVKLRCKAPQYDPGGGGVNVSRAIHQLGGEAPACFMAGGFSGDMLQQLLKERGVKYTVSPIQGITRQGFTVLEISTQQQYRFNEPGPCVQPEEWQAFLKHLINLNPPPDYLVASGSFPPGVPLDFLAHLATQTQSNPTRLIVDTSGEALAMAMQGGCYLIKPNLKELEALAGQPLPDETMQLHVARQLLQRYPVQVILLSLGDTGARYITQTESGFVPAPAVPVRSKVGAGDSMLAGVVLSLAKGWPLSEAVRYGVAAGSAAVMNPGTGLCRLEDTEVLYRKMGQPPTDALSDEISSLLKS